MIDAIMSKEQFLIEHNKLSPANLQTDLAALTLFQIAKEPLLKDNEWSFKLRIPLILWLGALPVVKEKLSRKSVKQEYKIYPQSS